MLHRTENWSWIYHTENKILFSHILETILWRYKIKISLGKLGVSSEKDSDAAYQPESYTKSSLFQYSGMSKDRTYCKQLLDYYYHHYHCHYTIITVITHNYFQMKKNNN